MKHYHFQVQAYDKLEENGTLYDVVLVFIRAMSEKGAIAKAKKLIKRKIYRVSKIDECFENHGMMAELQLLNLEIQKEWLKKV